MTPRFSQQGGGQSGVEYLRAVWKRRKWIGVAAFSAVFAVVVSLVLWMPDLYRAAATVLVQRQQVSEAFVRQSVTTELETRIQTIRQEITSRARLMDLITRLGLYPDLVARQVPIEAIVERMRRDISLDLKSVEQPVNGGKATVSFVVSFTGRDPQTVALVANTLASFYVEENIKIRERQASRTAEFLKEQLTNVKKELDRHEDLANDYRLQHIGELPQQMEANLASLERLNTQLRLNGENQIRAMDRRERFERQLAETEPAAPAGPLTAAPAARLAELRQQLSDLRTTYSDKYPDVERVQAEITALEGQLAQTVRREGESASQTEQSRQRARQGIKDIEQELASLEHEERALRQAVVSYEQRVENAPKRQQEIQELSRGSAAVSERYDTLLKRYEEAQLAENLEQGANVEQFRILDPALPPQNVAAPNRQRLFLIGLVVAIALAGAAMLGLDKLDTAFHSVDDLRSFAAVPVLVSIPRIVTRGDRRRRRWRVALAVVSAAGCLGLIIAAAHRLALGSEEIVRLMVRG